MSPRSPKARKKWLFLGLIILLNAIIITSLFYLNERIKEDSDLQYAPVGKIQPGIFYFRGRATVYHLPYV